MVAPTKNPSPGEIFGHLTVIGVTYREDKYLKVPVRCVCGKSKILEKGNLVSGRTVSCGCKMREMAKARSKYPFEFDIRIYHIWCAMISRCTKPHNPSWSDYGGRGITVSKSWMNFENFYKDMAPRPPGKMSLERKDNEKGYSKTNCIWATRRANQLNKRSTIFVEYLGKQINLIELGNLTNIPWRILYRRIIWNNNPVEESLYPVKFKSPNGQAVWNKKKEPA